MDIICPSSYFLSVFLPNLSNLWFCNWFYIWSLLFFLAGYQGLLIPTAGILILKASVSQMHDSQSSIEQSLCSKSPILEWDKLKWKDSSWNTHRAINSWKYTVSLESAKHLIFKISSTLSSEPYGASISLYSTPTQSYTIVHTRI